MLITPIDKTLELNGSLFYYLGVELTVARSGNDNFKRVFRHLSKPFQRQIDNETIDEEQAEKLLCTALSQTVLVGWNAETFPGNLEYSHENAFRLLMDDYDCRSAVLEFSRKSQNFYAQQKDDISGKS